MRRRALRFALTAVLCALAVPARANWIASGQVRYEHREWDRAGFTGTLIDLPVRYADVEVIDPNRSGSRAHLAWGKTDAGGNFSVLVPDSTTRSRVRLRVLTQTTQTSDLFVKVTTPGGSVYAANSSDNNNHGPNTNVYWGTMIAPAFSGGEAFNILDRGIYGADFIKHLTGSRPSSSKLVTFRWSATAGNGNSSTSGSVVALRDTAGYDDTVILHEWAHSIMNAYSKSASPGGSHFLSECNEDPRLAFDEARASFFGCSVRRYFGWPNANVYIRTDGGSGPGHALNGYDLEDPVEYACQGDTSEVSNSRTMWDIGDGPATTDLTVGLDDNPPDALTLPNVETWQVFVGPIKNATYVTAESFWDGWFDPTIANGNSIAMKSIWSEFTIEFFHDAFEPNNTIATAPLLDPNDPPIHLTYFYDGNGDGKGEVDTDVFTFNAVGGQGYTIETKNLLSANDTNLELLDTNGTTVLTSNNNRATGDKSSKITWTAPRTDRFYVRSKRASGGYTIYGSYDLLLSTP
jgi:hypothetical protein